MRVLVTGASGFVGSALLKRLAAESDLEPVALVRGQSGALAFDGERLAVADLESEALPDGCLAGIDVVVHAGARVHVMRDSEPDPLLAFRRANFKGTLNLARWAAEDGVKRFVFVSTAKVHGEASPAGEPFTEQQEPNPVDPYAQSKYEAEQALFDLARETGMELVFVRPPLVYGPGVKANFLTMMKWVELGIPLPLGAIENQRSLLALDNFVDFLTLCLQHPAAANEVFLVADGEDLSTTDLLRGLAEAMGRPPRLVHVPSSLVFGAARLLGQGAVAQRLGGDFQVSIDKARRVLGWRPPVSVSEGLGRAVGYYLEERSGRPC